MLQDGYSRFARLADLKADALLLDRDTLVRVILELVMLPDETFVGADRIQMAQDAVGRERRQNLKPAWVTQEHLECPSIGGFVKVKRDDDSGRRAALASISDRDVVLARQGILPEALMRKCLLWLQGDVAALAAASSVCTQWRQTASYVMAHIFRADLSSLGPRADLAALQAAKQQVGANIVGGARVLCLRGCTSLKPSGVRRVFLQGDCASLKLDLRGCPALYSLTIEFKDQCQAGTSSTDKLDTKRANVYGAEGYVTPSYELQLAAMRRLPKPEPEASQGSPEPLAKPKV
eukprot:1182629-Prorocentrum_minimum.AAC.1